MSGKALPEYLDLRQLAERGAVIEGCVPNRSLRRLVGSLADDAGEARAELRLSLDAVRRPVIRGAVATEVGLECQRCLQIYRQPLRSEFCLVLVQSEAEGQRLGEDYEPLLTEHEQVRTAELLEDELILALPIVAMHVDDEGCRMQNGERPEAGEAEAPSKPNAFAALAALKRKND